MKNILLDLASNVASNPGQLVSSRSSERQEANSAPVQTETSLAEMRVGIIVGLIAFTVGFFLGWMFPKFINYIKKTQKMKKIPSKNAVYPNDDIKNRSIHGSSSPLNSNSRSPPMPIMEVRLNLDENQSIGSPSLSKNWEKYSKTLPKEFIVKQTYL